MDRHRMHEEFSGLSTALVADACVRLTLPLGIAPPGIRPLVPGNRTAGRAVPVRHYGSADILLEAIGRAETGDVLIIDNGGRPDEACIGDLVVLEARGAGLAGIVLWGRHRDTEDLVRIGFPVFSYGVCPAGPRRLDPREPAALESARLGDVEVRRDDLVVADADGVVVAPGTRADDLLAAARAIRDTERRQADTVRGGRSLREQLRFDEYLRRRAVDPGYTFRDHLRTVGGAIEA